MTWYDGTQAQVRVMSKLGLIHTISTKAHIRAIVGFIEGMWS